MTIPTAAPLAVTSVTNSGGHFKLGVTPSPVGVVTVSQSVFVSGCRTVTGDLVSGLNGPHTISAMDSTSVTLEVTTPFTAGYNHGGGVWPFGAEMSSAELTKIDASLSTRACSKTGDVIRGTVSLSGSLSVTAGTSVLTTVAGSQITASGSVTVYGLGDNDDVQLLPPRTRSIMLSTLEALNEYNDATIGNWGFSGALNGNFGLVGPGNGGTLGVSDITGIFSAPPSSPRTFWLPLTRLHDGAVLVRATLYFFPSPYAVTKYAASTIPTVLPTLQLFRFDPSADLHLTSLAANGAVVFPTPATLAAYCTTQAVPATGSVLPTFDLLDVPVQIAAGTLLTDSIGNVFRVTAGALYSAGTPVPVTSVAPASGTFFATNSNHAAGDVLTWATTPAGLSLDATVAAGGLTGGLSPGYSQTLTFTPDDSLSLVDQSRYVYLLKWTDDNVGRTNGLNNVQTCYTGVRLDFSGITSMRSQ